MGLQIPVIELSGHVIEPQSKLFHFTISMTVDDDEVGFDGIAISRGVDYKYGTDINDHVVSIIRFFQEAINSYKRAKNVETSDTLANALIAIQNGLVV